jgi:hypothetical protein
LVKAVVIKRRTSDGVDFFKYNVSPGHVLLADILRVVVAPWHDINTGRTVKRVSIWVQHSINPNPSCDGFVPLELLHLEPR